jgi:hypothetical protein
LRVAPPAADMPAADVSGSLPPVIILSIPFYGELSPMLEIARALVETGIEVTVVTGRVSRTTVGDRGGIRTTRQGRELRRW